MWFSKDIYYIVKCSYYNMYFGSEAQGAGEEGLVHEINSSSRTMEPSFASRVGYELTNAFHLLMNREF